MVDIGVLGSVTVRSADGQALDFTSMLQRLLALLLVRAGAPVEVDAIVEALWEDTPPRTARKTVQIYVSRLRRLLGGDDRIVRTGSGYCLLIAPSELDSRRFDGLVDQATMARAAGDLRSAERLLDEALRTWRGPAYAGLHDIGAVAAEAARLDERRLVAFEDHVAVGLDLGLHTELVGRIATAVAQNPYRERLRGQLMTALYRDGRQAEALEAYRQTRELLVAEVGVEPTAELQRLHQSILRNEPGMSLNPAAPRAVASVYRFLPHDMPDFVGRTEDVAWLDAMAAADTSTLVISALAGAAGIGKTALAVHWAHRASAQYPDGQLFVNLRGYDSGPPQRPLDALVHLLRCLGVPRDQLPTEVEEAAAQYRALLADRRMLIVLDNARSADQVRPLLPGTPQCQVLITSRDRLSGLIAHDGARRLTVGLLPDDQALALLRRILGTRIDAEPEAAAEIVRLCAGLPLALRVAAANLSDRVEIELAEFATELAEGNRLAALTVVGDEDRAVQAVLERSYLSLTPQVQRGFRLLGLVPGPDFTVEALAALSGAPRAVAASTLDSLAAAHLVQPHMPHRYALHDLVREYAEAKSKGEDASALRGLLVYLKRIAVLANSFITSSGGSGDMELLPRLESAPDAMAWFDAERLNLTAAVSAAAASGEPELACEIAQPLGQYFHFAGHTGDWISTFETAFSAIEDLGETKAKYFVLNSLGNAYIRAGRYADAIAALQRCVDAREALEDHVAAGSSRHNLAAAYERVGRYEEALVLQEAALATFQKYEARAYEALVLGSGMSNVYQRMGLPDRALECLLRALSLVREQGSPFALIRTLNNIGWTYRALGQHAQALQHFHEGLELSQRVGDRYTVALITAGMADVHRDMGRYDLAIEMRLEAHDMIRAGLRGHEAESNNSLADLYVAATRPDLALSHYDEALTIARERGERHQEGRALAGIGKLTRSRPHLEAALQILEPISSLEADRARQALMEVV